MNFPRLRQSNLGAVAEDDPLPPEDRRMLGSRQTLDNLYRSQRPKLLRIFTRRTSNVEADDLVQEAFARYAGRSDQTVDPVVEPEAYLTRIATNLLRDRAKLAVRRATAHHQVFDDEVVGATDPLDFLEARDALRRLEAAVQRLKPRTREVFLLQRVEGMTYAQIAERVGMSAKGVKKQMAKALFELRRDVGSH